eukprot:12932828-Prorocentrum_lima.AAC.1
MPVPLATEPRTRFCSTGGGGPVDAITGVSGGVIPNALSCIEGERRVRFETLLDTTGGMVVCVVASAHQSSVCSMEMR